MDDIWHKTTGTEVAEDGSEIQLSVETAEGRQIVVRLAPEVINHLVVHLMNAKSKAAFFVSDTPPNHGKTGRSPIVADHVVLTDLADQGHSMVTIMTPNDGQFEFLVPILGNMKTRGKR